MTTTNATDLMRLMSKDTLLLLKRDVEIRMDDATDPAEIESLDEVWNDIAAWFTGRYE